MLLTALLALPEGGIPFTPGDYQFSDYEVLFPIPSNERRINTALSQNTGYN